MTRQALRPAELFWLFTRMSLLGFGGVLPWAHRLLVEQRRLMTPAEFGEAFALAQVLPGPSICNLAMIFAQREAGLRGAAAALAGMLGAPFVLVCLLVAAYGTGAAPAWVTQGLRGMSVVAAGLVVAMAVKLARALHPEWRNLLLALLMVVGVAVLHLPLLAVLATLAALGMLLFLPAVR